MFLKQPKIRDKKYTDLFRDLPCSNGVGCGGDTVAAHCGYGIPSHKKGGMGQKHCDSTVIPLCFNCHAKQHSMPEKEFWSRRNPYSLASKLRLYYEVEYNAKQKGKHINVMSRLVRMWKNGGIK